MLKLFIFAYLVYSLAEANKDFLAGIKKCHYTDDDCWLNAIQYVLTNYANKGIKELGLLPLDPLHIKKMKLAKNEKSPINLDLNFSEVDLIGLEGAQVKHVSAYDKDLKKPLELEVFLPEVILRGQYTVNGKILILPIVGKGLGEFTLQNLLFHAKIKAKLTQKDDGEIYVEVVNFNLTLEPGRVMYNLGGLFNGQKDLSNNMHSFLNDNWQDIFNELKPDISEALGLVFKQMLNSVYAKHSVDTLFLID